MAQRTTLAQLKELLGEKLRTYRPRGRYSPEDRDWQRRAVEAVLDRASNPEIVAELLMSQAAQIEGKATKSANDLLRRVARDGQPPLDWFEQADSPISFEVMEANGDELVRCKYRIRLGDATGDDYRAWAHTERERLNKDISQREAAIEGALIVADFLDGVACRTLTEWQERREEEVVT